MSSARACRSFANQVSGTRLNENRIWSVKRAVSCKTMFLNSRPARIDEATLTVLNEAGRVARRVAAKAGHNHELAVKPAVQQKIVAIRRRLRKKQPADCLSSLALSLAFLLYSVQFTSNSCEVGKN